MSRSIQFEGRECVIERCSECDFSVRQEDPREGLVLLGVFSVARDADGLVKPYAVRFSCQSTWADTKRMLELARVAIAQGAVRFEREPNE